MAGGAAFASKARNRWLLASFAITALLLLLLLWNVVHTQQTLAQLEETQLSLERAAGELPFHIQGMQTSVRLAAESGDLNWRQQHQEHRQEARSTLTRIEQMTLNPAVAKVTERLKTRLEEAEAFHQRVFERLVQGEKEAAKSILGKWPYIRNRNAMREGSEAISNLLQEDVRGRLAEQRQLAGSTALAALLLSLVMLLSWLLSLRNWNLNVRERREKEAEILYLSYHDELTGLPNRRYLIEAGEREVAQARRYGHPLAVLILDIDHFKWINDTYGHLAGDQVLIRLSEALNLELRAGDLLARMGGEEFTVLLPETSLPFALEVAERLRRSAAKTATEHEGQTISITISIGVTCTEDGEAGLDTLLGTADDALYGAKESGRDGVHSKTVDAPAPVSSALGGSQ